MMNPWHDTIPGHPSRFMPPEPTERRALLMPFPLDNGFLAKLCIPIGMRKSEAERLCAFVKSLVMPEE